jgi:ELWxxDGT repeat protein
VTTFPLQVWGGDDRVYFPADDGTNGVELWTSDGTAAGTVRLTQAGPGSADADIRFGNPVGNGTALAVTIEGNPWFSLGTPSTTFEIADLDPTDHDRTQDFVTSGGSLYFAGDDGVHGQELWRVALADLGGSNAAAYGEGCSSSSAVFLSAGSRAAIHSTFVLRASPVTPNATAVLLIGIGAADTPLNGSCSLLTPPLLSPATMSRSNGVAAFAIPLANDPSLVGAVVYCQVAAAAPGGAAYGVVDLSQGLQAVIGR